MINVDKLCLDKSSNFCDGKAIRIIYGLTLESPMLMITINGLYFLYPGETSSDLISGVDEA